MYMYYIHDLFESSPYFIRCAFRGSQDGKDDLLRFLSFRGLPDDAALRAQLWKAGAKPRIQRKWGMKSENIPKYHTKWYKILWDHLWNESKSQEMIRNHIAWIMVPHIINEMS